MNNGQLALYIIFYWQYFECKWLRRNRAKHWKRLFLNHHNFLLHPMNLCVIKLWGGTGNMRSTLE